MRLVSQMFQERLCFLLLQVVAILKLEMSLLKPSLIKHLYWHYKPVLYTLISELKQKSTLTFLNFDLKVFNCFMTTFC